MDKAWKKDGKSSLGLFTSVGNPRLNFIALAKTYFIRFFLKLGRELEDQSFKKKGIVMFSDGKILTDHRFGKQSA